MPKSAFRSSSVSIQPHEGDLGRLHDVMEALRTDELEKSKKQLRRMKSALTILRDHRAAIDRVAGAGVADRIDAIRETARRGRRERPHDGGAAPTAADRAALAARFAGALGDVGMTPSDYASLLEARNRRFKDELEDDPEESVFIMATIPTYTATVHVPPASRVYRAPFAGWRFAYTWRGDGDGEYRDIEQYVDNATGQAGSTWRYANRSASNSDWFEMVNRSRVGVWYRPRRTAPIHARVVYRQLGSGYSLTLRDEMGASDMYAYLYSAFRLGVTGVDADADGHTFWKDHVSGDDDRTFTRSMDPTNVIHEARVTSTHPAIGGVDNYIEVGVDDRMWGSTNDVSVTCRYRSRWVIEEIELSQPD